MDIIGLDQEMLEDDLRLAREVLGDLREDDPRRAAVERYIAHLEAYQGRPGVTEEDQARIDAGLIPNRIDWIYADPDPDLTVIGVPAGLVGEPAENGYQTVGYADRRCRGRRLAHCVEAWPDAETGGYDPKCCRFPKSCSATVYDADRVDPADLEPCPIHGDGPCAPIEAITSEKDGS